MNSSYIFYYILYHHHFTKYESALTMTLISNDMTLFCQTGISRYIPNSGNIFRIFSIFMYIWNYVTHSQYNKFLIYISHLVWSWIVSAAGRFYA